MKLLKTGCCLAVFFLMLLTITYSQPTDKIAFEKLGVAEGLPTEVIFNIVQDDKGFIWAATLTGLAKWDGYRMKVYKYSSANHPDSFKLGDLGGGLIKTKNGKLWMGGIATGAGLACFDPVTEKFSQFYPYSIKPGKETNTVYLIQEDAVGNIWCITVRGSSNRFTLTRFDPATGLFKQYQFEQDPYFQILNKTSNIITEADGTNWIMDQQGNLNRYNRLKDTFEIVLRAGAIFSEKPDTIKGIKKGGEDRLIITGHHGLYVYDAAKGKIITSFLNAPETQVAPLWGYEDQRKNYWIGYPDGSITLLDAATHAATKFTLGKVPLLLKKPVASATKLHIELETKRGLWFQGTDAPDGYCQLLMYYSFESKTFRIYDDKFNVKNNPFDPDKNDAYHFFEDRTGLIWLFTYSGIYKQASKKRQIELYQKHKEGENVLPSDIIQCLLEDTKKRIWIGTTQGLALYESGRDSFTVFKNNPADEHSISSNNIRTICESRNGKIWLTSDNGLNVWDEQTGYFQHLFYNPKNKDQISNVFVDKKQRIWMGLSEKGIYVLDSNANIVHTYAAGADTSLQLFADNLSVFYEDSKGNTWIGWADWRGISASFGLYRLNEKEVKRYRFIQGDSNSLSSGYINFITEDEKKRIWINTNSGLSMYDDEHNNFKRFESASIGFINAFAKENNGKLWFTSVMGGLVRIDEYTGRSTLFGEEQGLLHNQVGVYPAIAVDASGKFWLPTQRGLSVFDPATKIFTGYFEKDGFQPYGRTYCEITTSNGEIWIGGTHGLNRIVPARFAIKDSIPPAIIITQVAINDTMYSRPDGVIFKKAIAYTDTVELAYQQKDISFSFVSLHYLRPEDNLYSWKLENYDKDWSLPSRQRMAIYTNLPPGTYVFKLKASNADGIWNEKPTTLTVIISPPWWRTWWAYLICLVLLGGVVWGYIHLRSRKLQMENRRLESKVNERTLQLENSIKDLKSTQAQLIQSEKMASLGELTAGIAHEIQNPLNFVNNFSDVNTELIEEMGTEIANGNVEEVKAIAEDIRENNQKIAHHGRRAEGIVKGMLQHSRSGSGPKEPTDINALADEYLRLAYHGLRAKDKTFNAKLETDFDAGIGKIEVQPQDLGRVLLNLMNNAFYAVSEKKKQLNTAYEPTVFVGTKRIGNKVEVSVSDNGNGIPQNIINKIFQPFFTTKPTGQGTGLGLSLAYDIIKAHNGELKVKTKEGESTEFIITLPVR